MARPALATRVTDQPADIGDFESCVATIAGMWLGPEDAEAGTEDGEEPATYEFLQLDVDGVDATFNDGSDATLEVPGEAPLTFNQEFDVREDTRTTFTADFTPVQRGGAGGYVLQPVP